MDTVSSLVFHRGRNLASPLAALVLLGVVLTLLAFAAALVGAGTVGLTPDIEAAPFRWFPVEGQYA
ncbi:MAG: hypothetical protein M3432_05290 [Chloroflexota bacterium]|nr:hypothetical protein [Chloroflexota bacterium]